MLLEMVTRDDSTSMGCVKAAAHLRITLVVTSQSTRQEARLEYGAPVQSYTVQSWLSIIRHQAS